MGLYNFLFGGGRVRGSTEMIYFKSMTVFLFDVQFLVKVDSYTLDKCKQCSGPSDLTCDDMTS